MSGGPPSDPMDDVDFEGPPLLPCFLSFRLFLKSVVWLLMQKYIYILVYTDFGTFC